METQTKTITVETTVKAPVEKVWEYWTLPEHITKWNSPSDDWHTPSAINDLRVGGHFIARMEAKDGSFGFDFGGVYDEVKIHELIAYTLGDGRKVRITFSSSGPASGGPSSGHETKVVETFEPENAHPQDFQKAGWQAIIDNFRKYTESNG